MKAIVLLAALCVFVTVKAGYDVTANPLNDDEISLLKRLLEDDKEEEAVEEQEDYGTALLKILMKRCGTNNAVCNRLDDCCVPYTCQNHKCLAPNNGGGGSNIIPNCQQNGQPCNNFARCCQGSCMNGQCSGSNLLPCTQNGQQCNNFTPCCQGACMNGRCFSGQSNCRSFGQQCNSFTPPCCQGAFCMNGQCLSTGK